MAIFLLLVHVSEKYNDLIYFWMVFLSSDQKSDDLTLK